MNVNRFSSLAGALAISAIQWAAFFSLVVQASSLPTVAAPVANDKDEVTLPEIVVSATRPS